MRPIQSQGVKQLLYDAKSAAGKFNHRFVHTEYLLLGLLKHTNSATNLLRTTGVDCREMSEACKKRCRVGHHDSEENIKLTPRAQHVMALAGEQMLELSHRDMDSRHILLGLLMEDEGLGGIILREHGITADSIRQNIIDEDRQLLASNSPDTLQPKTGLISRKSAGSLWRMWSRT